MYNFLETHPFIPQEQKKTQGENVEHESEIRSNTTKRSRKSRKESLQIVETLRTELKSIKENINNKIKKMDRVISEIILEGSESEEVSEGPNEVDARDSSVTNRLIQESGKLEVIVPVAKIKHSVARRRFNEITDEELSS